MVRFLVLFLIFLSIAFLFFHKLPRKTNSISHNLNHKNIQGNSKDFVSYGSRNKKEIALTFDADMTPKMRKKLELGQVKSWYNKEVIEILKNTNIQATLFLTGMWIEVYPNETKELAENPLFELANHSYSHPSFNGRCFGLGEISDDKDEEQITKTQELLKEVAGVDNKYFRFPGGCYAQKDLDVISRLGLIAVGWDVGGRDGFNNDEKSIAGRVLSLAQNGSIIVLHIHGGPNAPKTAQALSLIIPNLKSRGFDFVKISNLTKL